VLIFCIYFVRREHHEKEGKAWRPQLEVNVCDPVCCTTYIQVKKKNVLCAISFKTCQMLYCQTFV